jgi:hypothetical protein
MDGVRLHSLLLSRQLSLALALSSTVKELLKTTRMHSNTLRIVSFHLIDILTTHSVPSTPSPYCTLVPLAFTHTPPHNRQNVLMKHIDPTPAPLFINYAHSFFESAHPHEVRSSLSIAGAQALQTFMFHCTFSPSRVNLTLKSQRLLRLSCNAPHSLALKISTTSPVYLPSPPNKDLLKPTRYSST